MQEMQLVELAKFQYQYARSKRSPLLSDQKNKSEIAECTGAEVSISDNGKGIPDSIRKKLFDPFFSTATQ